MKMTNLTEQAYWFIFQNDQLILPFPEKSLIDELKSAFLREFELTDTIYCAEIAPNYTLPNNVNTIPLRKALDTLGEQWYVLAAKAYSVINWDRYHHFCGHCGIETRKRPRIFERVCPQCEHIFYPRISPSIIVRIHKGDQILMARSPHFTPGAFGLIAGFVEGGESLEAATHREVKEEIGISIKNLRYFGSQAWPFPDSLMIAFTAEYDAGELVIDPNEIESAGWYAYDNLPGRPSSKMSLSTKLIDDFIAQQSVKKEA